MAASAPITGSKQVKPAAELTEREIAEETLEHLRHLRGQLEEWAPLLGQFRVSGLLAIRRAARNPGS